METACFLMCTDMLYFKLKKYIFSCQLVLIAEVKGILSVHLLICFLNVDLLFYTLYNECKSFSFLVHNIHNERNIRHMLH